jgi:hypothetical protein
VQLKVVHDQVHVPLGQLLLGVDASPYVLFFGVGVVRLFVVISAVFTPSVNGLVVPGLGSSTVATGLGGLHGFWTKCTTSA